MSETIKLCPECGTPGAHVMYVEPRVGSPEGEGRGPHDVRCQNPDCRRFDPLMHDGDAKPKRAPRGRGRA